MDNPMDNFVDCSHNRAHGRQSGFTLSYWTELLECGCPAVSEQKQFLSRNCVIEPDGATDC